jgi:hypothetical protein
MGEKHMSIFGRIREALSDPDAAVEAPPESGNAPAKQREPGGLEDIAAAVALAIDRGRRASRSMAPALKIAGTAGPDEWATSGRLAQVNRSPARDPWNR